MNNLTNNVDTNNNLSAFITTSLATSSVSSSSDKSVTPAEAGVALYIAGDMTNHPFNPNNRLYQLLGTDVPNYRFSTSNPLRDFQSLLEAYKNGTGSITITVLEESTVIAISKQIPSSFEGLMTEFKSYLLAKGGVPSPNFPQGFLKAVADTLAATHGISLNPDGTLANEGDWSILLGSDPIYHASVNLYENSDSNPVIKMMNNFLTLARNSPTSGQDSLAHFFGNLDQYLTTTALIQTPDHAYYNNGLPSGAFNQLASYQAFFELFGPSDPTGQLFQAEIKAFAKQQVAENGYFLPSHSLNAFATRVYENKIGAIIGGTSSLDGNSSEKAQILDRILRLLIKLISSLQNVGIIQAERLRFLTQYQQAYTTMQTNMHVFIRGEDNPLGRSDGNAPSDRNDINSSFNANLIDNLRALRGIQEDNAKKLQTNINQTNDAVNQQTDMATSFLQQLSTLLSTILR